MEVSLLSLLVAMLGVILGKWHKSGKQSPQTNKRTSNDMHPYSANQSISASDSF